MSGGQLLAVVMVIIVAGFAGRWLNQTLSVKSWVIDAPAPIRQALEKQMASLQQRDFLHTSPGLLREQWLERIPDMLDVQIERKLPHALHIHAQARTPLALWQDARNQLHLMDSFGHAYRLLREGESPDLPLLRVRESLLPATHRLLAVLAEHSVHRLHALSEIHAGTDDWKLYFSHGVAWSLAQKQEQQTIHKLARLMAGPRWQQGKWSVDTRMESRWFIRPAGRGGII